MREFYYVYADFVSKAHKQTSFHGLKTIIELAEEGYEFLAEDNLYEAYYEAGDVLFFIVSLANQFDIDLSIPFNKPRLYANADLEHSLSAIMRLVKLLLRDAKPIDSVGLAFKLSRLLSAITQDVNKTPTQLAYLNMHKLNERFSNRKDLDALVQEASYYAQCTFEQGISLQRFADVYSRR